MDAGRISFTRSGVVFLLSLLIFSAVFLYMCRELYIRVEKNIHLQAEAAAATLANELNCEFGEVQQSAQMLAQLVELESLSDAELQSMLEKMLSTLHGKYPIVFGGSLAFEPFQHNLTSRHTMFYRYFDHGTLMQGGNVGENYDYFSRAWYMLPRMLNRPDWTEPYYDKGLTGELMTTCTVPFFRRGLDGNRVFNGVVTVDIRLGDLCSALQKRKLNGRGYMVLLSRFGRYLAHPERELVMNETIFSAFSEDDRTFREIGRDMISGKKLFRKVPRGNGYNGSLWLASAPVEQNGWSVGILYPERELFESMKQAVLRMGVIGIGAIVLQLLLAGLITGHFNWIFKRLFK